jgi:hypothetical protein
MCASDQVEDYRDDAEEQYQGEEILDPVIAPFMMFPPDFVGEPGLGSERVLVHD